MNSGPKEKMRELGHIVSFFVVVVLISNSSCSDNNYSSKEEEYYAKFGCRLRFNLASVFKGEGEARGEPSNCYVAGELNQICALTLNVSFVVQEPYVTLRNGTVRGVIPGEKILFYCKGHFTSSKRYRTPLAKNLLFSRRIHQNSVKVPLF